jgi:hypothetical protein
MRTQWLERAAIPPLCTWAINLTYLTGTVAIHASQSPGVFAVTRIIVSQLCVIGMQACDTQVRRLAPRVHRGPNRLCQDILSTLHKQSVPHPCAFCLHPSPLWRMGGKPQNCAYCVFPRLPGRILLTIPHPPPLAPPHHLPQHPFRRELLGK